MIFYIIAALILLFLFYLFLIMPDGRADFTRLREVYYAHRGLHSKEKGIAENTLEAFEAAADNGFGIELDLRLSTDGQVFVFHDNNLKRTCEVDIEVESLAYEELSKYRVYGTDSRIPLFSEVLELVGQRAPLIIELKQSSKNAELCRKTMELIRENRPALYCVESFDPMIVAWFRANEPQVVRGQLSMDFMKKKGLPSFVKRFAMTFLLTNVIARPNFIAFEHAGAAGNPSHFFATRLFGAAGVAWTVRSKDELEKARKRFSMFIFEGFIP